ncbi:MotA/TolQ/ExbB proton channel family protein [Aureibaculum luteum]|uniref:MotA/TolQ/ExbB proton channel family protein n=1 Tax=Aureibaculum luteum TaxID=1548456 RepID=UPI000E4B37D4|nr:MotA/TolQ/ExbB proton channel family protein [Aureibaculum luteum]
MLFDRLNEGGPTFMYPLLLILFLVIVLIIQGFLKKESSDKTIKLISSITLFALVWGFLGQLIGMIGGFDSIQIANQISPGVLAGGLKVSLLPPVFGMVVFLIGRLGIIALTWIKK